MGEQPFETVVEAHHAEVHRYLRRLTARASEAEDLLQETFLRAYRAWRSLGPGANVRAWLFAIATNLARNHFRAEKRRRAAHAAVEVLGPVAALDGPEGTTGANELWRRLEATIRALPLKQRAAFVLRKLHDLDYDGIAWSLACSPESARANVFQALRKIRRSLNGTPLPPKRP